MDRSERPCGALGTESNGSHVEDKHGVDINSVLTVFDYWLSFILASFNLELLILVMNWGKKLALKCKRYT